MAPWGGGNFQDNPLWRALVARVGQIEKRLGITTNAVNTNAVMTANTAKRFRIAVRSVTLSLLTPVDVTVQWSTPMPSAVYNMDVSCTAMLGMPTVTVVSQDATGATIRFTPTLAVAGATVVVLAVSPASS